MKLPGGAVLALTVISVSEDFLWNWELVVLGAGVLLPWLSRLPYHGLYISCLTFYSFYENVLVVKIKS